MEESLEANLTANQLSERLDNGKLHMPIYPVGDNDGCFKCATNDNPTSTELMHCVSYLRNSAD
eukprot:12194737-Prorocentrum_lima.AAC.1